MNDKDRREVTALAAEYRRSRTEFLKASAAVKLKIDEMLRSEEKKLSNVPDNLFGGSGGEQIQDSVEVLRELQGQIPQASDVIDPDFEEVITLEMTPERMNRGALAVDALDDMVFDTPSRDHNDWNP